MASDESPLSNVQPGDILAEKYRVERVLGQGGMGLVVLAEHLDLRERVAIKFLLDAPAGNTELAERFLREARAAVKIKSEHVVRVIDVGRLPSGSPYMVMEYLEGEDLSQRLAAGALPIEDAVDYVVQCCEAMHVAHRAGIVHRDLKPANLFLTQRHDGSPLIKVLDFGISKVKSVDPNQLSLTHTQAMMGSPLYMSPEQMRSSKDVSAAADIWSLGVILHELLSGDVPFKGETFPEVLVQVMSEQPLPIRSLRGDVPAGLEAVILHCLRKDPTQRPASVAALAVGLAPFASSRTIGILTRLRGSLSRPPPPPPSGVRSPLALDATRLTDAGVAAPPAVPPQGTLASAGTREASGEGDLHPAKTHTAWGGPPAPVAAAIPSWRRHRPLVIAAGALFVAGIVAVGLMNGESGPGGASAASSEHPGSAPAALPPPPNVAPAALPPPNVAPVREAAAEPAKIEPLKTEPAKVEPDEPAPAQAAPGVAAVSEAASAAPATEHKLAAAPTEATVEPPSAPRTARAPASKSTSKTAATKMPRVRATAKTTPANVPTTNVETPTRPAPPPAKPRSKSLSIEFK